MSATSELLDAKREAMQAHADIKALRERVGKVAEMMVTTYGMLMADALFEDILPELQAIAEGR